MSNSSSTTSGGIGFFGLLTILFIALKLTHCIDWSWWWVLSPSLFCIGMWAVVFVVVLIITAAETPAERQIRIIRRALK